MRLNYSKSSLKHTLVEIKYFHLCLERDKLHDVFVLFKICQKGKFVQTRKTNTGTNTYILFYFVTHVHTLDGCKKFLKLHFLSKLVRADIFFC